VPDGQAEVGGSLPLSALSGIATVSDTIAEIPAAGNVIQTQNVQFTPGLTGATAIVSADILEIDTKNREVAFNGEIEGARGRVDVLADFIQLAPGPNELEFIDTGNPEGISSLRVFYRSGWLG
jgi:lipopolysaccharide assembly outer membrane protein LptD (OstA)